jgi:hypothetical protein
MAPPAKMCVVATIAVALTPLTLPQPADPTRVEVAPVSAFTERRRQLPVSLTRMLPKPSQDTATGDENRATVPVDASTTPDVAPPASVAVAPVDIVTTRTRCADVSAT